MMINAELVRADLSRAAHQWRLSGFDRSADAELSLDSCVQAALAIVTEPTETDLPRGRFCMVTKGPHLDSPLALACVTARLVAFGVTVNALRRLDQAGQQIAEALYPRAARYFARGPTTPTLWENLRRRFDTDEFTAIFGRRYDRSLVVAGADVLRENGLAPHELTRIWEQGRTAVTRDTLTRSYGTRAAQVILGDADSYEWFHGRHPIGISRIASAMTAFAMRHERVNNGDPVIVINGHVPGLAHLFNPRAWVFDLGISSKGAQIGEVRRLLAGGDGQPDRCAPGSLRRDAVEGVLPVDSTATIDSRHNLVHCSDGLVVGLIEVHKLMPDRRAVPDLLTRRLANHGLTEPELSQIVLSNPRVLPATPNGYLSDLTRGLAIPACTDTILQVVPPVFGAPNGWADGISVEMLGNELQRALGDPMPTSQFSVHRPAAAPVTVGTRAESLGRAAIDEGRVGMLIPAGGTGGRFGGYDLAEDDPARHKQLAPVFRLDDRKMSAMDIRMANIRFWDGGLGDRLPAAVMASPASEAGLRRWRETLDEPYRKTLRILLQHGIYRIDIALADDNPRNLWIDAVLRDSRGRPSLKPSGSMGLLASFLISGLFEIWENRGVEYVVTANADDAGFRVEPGIIGHLRNTPEVDAVVVGVPWGYSAQISRGGDVVEARGDESGWVLDAHGVPFATPIPRPRRSYDEGDALRLTAEPTGPKLAVMNAENRPGSLFNTNQVYLRLASLRRLADATGSTDPVEVMRRISATLPLSFEDRSVLLDGSNLAARQISQPLHGLLSRFSRCDVAETTRRVAGGIRSSYAPLKNRSDVFFAQQIVDALHRNGDDLRLAPD